MKSEPFVHFNKYISGIDQQDQMVFYYPSVWKKKFSGAKHWYFTWSIRWYSMLFNCIVNRNILKWVFTIFAWQLLRKNIARQLLYCYQKKHHDRKKPVFSGTQKMHLMDRCDTGDESRTLHKRWRRC